MTQAFYGLQYFRVCPLYPRGCTFYPPGVSHSSTPCPDNPRGGAELITGDEPVPLPYSSFVLRPALFVARPLFATYALKWNSYFRTLILIEYPGCFVLVLCQFFSLEKTIKIFNEQKPGKEEHQHKQSKPENLTWALEDTKFSIWLRAPQFSCCSLTGGD